MNLSVRNASFQIDGVSILSGIDLEIPGGKTTVLLGPNGAGKSTLMKIVSGYLKPTAGEVRIDDRNPMDIPLDERARMLGVLTQKINLEFAFTAREVIAMGRMPYGVSQGFDEITSELIRLFDINPEQSYLNMSGGEQQLTQLCRVFAQVWHRGAGAFLLLDEPMTALDLKHQARVAAVLKSLSAQGLGQLVVMHDINLAADLADEVVLMSHGRVTAKGAVAETLRAEFLERTYETAIREIGGDTERYFRAELEQ